MSDKIKYFFNTGDKIKYSNIFKEETVGIITDKVSTTFQNERPDDRWFNFEVIQSKSFKIGEVLHLPKSCQEYELLETTNFEGCERLQYKDSKKYKTIVKDGFIEFRKMDDYIEFENGSKIIGIDIAKGKDQITRGNNANFITLIDDDFEVKEYDNRLICIKDCIYPKGTLVDIVNRFDKYIIVEKGKNKNVFTYEELDEYFMEYIDISKITFKVVENGVVGLRNFYYE